MAPLSAFPLPGPSPPTRQMPGHASQVRQRQLQSPVGTRGERVRPRGVRPGRRLGSCSGGSSGSSTGCSCPPRRPAACLILLNLQKHTKE